MFHIKTKIIHFFIMIIIGSVATASPPAIPTDLLTGWDTIQQNTLQKDIVFLSSNELQGRLSLTPGDQQSIDWLVEEFKKAGLKPANGNSYLQAVPIIEYIPDTKKSFLALEKDGKTLRWKKPEVISSFPEDIHLSANVIFAGYGITAPELHYDDYKNIDAKGKIVLILEHEPQETDPKSIFNGIANTIYSTNRVKVLNAQQHGAIAVLIAPEPNRNHPSNQERYLRIGGSVKRKIPLPAQVLVEDEITIPVAVISDKIAHKIAGKDISLSHLQTAIDKDLTSHSQMISGIKVTLHNTNVSRKTGTTYNVVGLIEGIDPVLKNETIILSAHHDHDGKSSKKIWHGADDNASGTVGIVALAQAMSRNTETPEGLKPKRSILFVVFASEERGLLGAYYMTQHALRPLSTTRAMINFDMVGRNETRSEQTDGLIDIPRDTSNRLNLIGSHYSPGYDQTVITQNRFVELDLDHRFDSDHALNVFFRSDQFPFVLHHVPAFWWFTGFHPDYHHTTDTAEKINYAKLQKIIRLAYLSTYEFANEENPPPFIVNPEGKI